MVLVIKFMAMHVFSKSYPIELYPQLQYLLNFQGISSINRKFPRTGVPGHREPSDVGTRNQTQELQFSRKREHLNPQTSLAPGK